MCLGIQLLEDLTDVDVSGRGLREPAVGWGLGTGSCTVRLAKKTRGGTVTSGPGAEDSTSGASGKPPSGRKHCQRKDQTLEGKREHCIQEQWS